MIIPIYIEISDETPSECGDNCPFLIDGDCALFPKEGLDDVVLPEGHTWQTDCVPNKQRCWSCICSFEGG